MTFRSWSDVWQGLGHLANICDARDIGAAAFELAMAQASTGPPPDKMESPSAEYIHLHWHGKTVTINAGKSFTHTEKHARSRRRPT